MTGAMTWMEAHCDFSVTAARAGDFWVNCLETSEGIFAIEATEAISEFKKDGWTVRKGKWCCPKCAKRLDVS